MANLYLITSLFDEGIYESSFRVVEAESELKIAQHILAHPSPWQWFLDGLTLEIGKIQVYMLGHYGTACKTLK